ncbi:uncharacterized protein LOC141836033 [Curcuma longa]|uniref:uncharacterized protein LOC141836033 n=1 Tax=Curcuma longa TaxID=136217 RepID=UPI003D9DEF7E
MDLFAIKQKSKESLKDYLRRFNQGAQEVPAAPSEVLVSAFSQGLIEGDFFRSLIKKPPENFDMLMTRADKYIHVEEAQSARRINADSSSHGGPESTACSGCPKRASPATSTAQKAGARTSG